MEFFFGFHPLFLWAMLWRILDLEKMSGILGSFRRFVSLRRWWFSNGGFLKWWPNNHGFFLLKNDHFGVFWGYHHLRKTPKYFFIFTPNAWGRCFTHFWRSHIFFKGGWWKNPPTSQKIPRLVHCKSCGVGGGPMGGKFRQKHFRPLGPRTACGRSGF